VTAEKAIYPPLASGGATIIQTVGYAGGSEVPVFTKTYSTDGTLTSAGWSACPGDCAAVVRYSTPDRSTKNHPIYCFNYYHAISNNGSAATVDNLQTGQKNAISTYASAWISGFSDGTTTVHRSRPSGDLVTGSLVLPQISHRDLPR
jgi:hypothetical protein